jgi:hypothetical protein
MRQRRLVMHFEGTVEELRDWLVQLADDVESRRWELTGTRVQAQPRPGACMDGHQTEVPCSGELYCPQEESCDVCGTVEPNGGLVTRWESGRPVGQMCAYRVGCQPGHQRPRTG